MASLDIFSIAILLGSLLVLAGILSSLVALRFGAPLLLVFLLLGMLAGEGGPGGLKFDNVGAAYLVGSIALALILFDGGLRTRLATFRNVLAPAATLATAGVLITTLLTAPVAKLALGIGWLQALLVGAVVASTDAAAVFLLINSRGLRLRPRVRATLEVESGTNDPFAVFLTLLLVEFLLAGDQSWSHALITFLRDTVLGCIIGVAGGRIITLVLNRLDLPQGLHAPFVAVSAVVVFASANLVHSSGFLAVYLAGLVVGNRQTRAHNSVVVFLDAVTWLAQIVMFVLLGLLVWPQRMGDSLFGAIAIALFLMLVARPVAVFLCLAPFGFQWREKLFVSWVGLRGAVAIFLASIPLLVGLPTRLSVLRRGLRGRAVVAADPGLDRGLRGPQARHVVCAQRSAAAPGRARSARPVDARNRRLSGAGQQPVPAPRADPELGAADAWSCATRKFSRRRKPIRCARAITSICWRRRRRRRRSTASSSKCRRRPRPIRGCSAISSWRATRRWARWPKFMACRLPPTIWKWRWPISSPSISAVRPRPATSSSSARSRCWRTKSAMAASPPSACGWPSRKSRPISPAGSSRGGSDCRSGSGSA